MSDIETSIEELKDIYELIKKAQINFKKCPTTRKTKGYLQAKIQCIDEYWTSFRTAHQTLFKLTTKSDRDTLNYFVNDVHGECEEVYTCLKADLTDSLLSRQQQGESSALNTSSSSDRADNYTPDVKLPQINLPTFSGAYEEWQSFEDTFVALIHANKGLSDVQKLHYLKSCVIGEAKNTIKHFQITEKNYKPAWDTLKNRYSHKRLIVNAILKRLFSLKKVNVQSPTQLKALIDNTKECLTSLNALNIYTGTWDPLIIFLVIQKLDQESHRAWEAYVSAEYFEELPTFNNFTTFLENRICTLELTSPVTAPKDKIKERSFTATTSMNRVCSMCKEDHLLCHCKEFGKLDPDKRSEFVKEQRLCYNCLAAGHPVLHCKQKTSRRICGRRHHSLLHSHKKNQESTGKEEKKPSPGLSSMHTNVEEHSEDEQDWLKRQKEFELGDIVLLKDEQTPPSKWALGRVLEKHPGPDGVCRVYTVWSNKHVTQRSVSKLCALPIDKS
ncbi:uncharacterized protein LOC114359173 [Ostrinia furnacalis]|uniref:uncharacterized protein LOC114359173 n=1 Tax=Ostrinia furnacalis TaxID=93504 RepID=UPI00103E6AC3|nr:uncharacterized protein LOC114359173 [Ostrinia furnacalis]